MYYAPKRPIFCKDFEKPALFAKYLSIKTESINNYLPARFSSSIFNYVTKNCQMETNNDAQQKSKI